MSSASGEVNGDLACVHRCLGGDTEALAALRQSHHQVITNILLARGASVSETEELLADLWGDCVPNANDSATLLEKFTGKCSLQAWLATVATRRWIDLKRKQVRHGETTQPADTALRSEFLENLPAAAESFHENALIELLRESLQAGFAACPSGDLLMLRLVYIHDLTQRELMRMWNWSESKVSRRLSNAMRTIQQATLEHLEQRDPWLNLPWQDFVELCRNCQLEFL